MKIAIIPARGESKRIPGKNIRDFHGKPMLAWSIEAALKSGCFDHVLVSTDSPEITEVAVSYGARVPFARPDALADDFTPLVPVVRHAIEESRALYGEISDVCCILPTAPFASAHDIRAAHAKLSERDYSFVFTVTRV